MTKLCFKTADVNEGAPKNPPVLLASLFPALKKVLRVFSPTLGLNVDAGTQAAEEMKKLMKVGKFSLEIIYHTENSEVNCYALLSSTKEPSL